MDYRDIILWLHYISRIVNFVQPVITEKGLEMH